jgi:hypothetical protein
VHEVSFRAEMHFSFLTSGGGDLSKEIQLMLIDPAINLSKQKMEIQLQHNQRMTSDGSVLHV